MAILFDTSGYGVTSSNLRWISNSSVFCPKCFPGLNRLNLIESLILVATNWSSASPAQTHSAPIGKRLSLITLINFIETPMPSFTTLLL